MLATQLGPIRSRSKLAECNEMLSLDVFLVHDPPKSPAYEQERRQKAPPCNLKWQRQIKEKGEKKKGRKRGVKSGGCRPANGGGPEGNRFNVMSAMNALSGRMCARVCVGHTGGAPTRLWGLVYIIWSPLCTSLTAIF